MLRGRSIRLSIRTCMHPPFVARRASAEALLLARWAYAAFAAAGCTSRIKTIA